MLNTDKTIRKLCETVDAQEARIAGLRETVKAAIVTLNGIDSTLVNRDLSDREALRQIIAIVVDAVGPEAQCAGIPTDRPECKRLATEQKRPPIIFPGYPREAVSQA